jgi:hypothetical protein
VGSVRVQGQIWSCAALDWAGLQEPVAAQSGAAILDAAAVGEGTRPPAAQRGAVNHLRVLMQPVNHWVEGAAWVCIRGSGPVVGYATATVPPVQAYRQVRPVHSLQR